MPNSLDLDSIRWRLKHDAADAADIAPLVAEVERLRAESDGRLTTWNDCRERLWAAEAERDQLRHYVQQIKELPQYYHDRVGYYICVDDLEKLAEQK